VAARADFRVGLVIADVFVAAHACCAIGAHPRLVHAVTDATLRMALAQRDLGKPVQSGEYLHFVATRAAGRWRNRASVRLVATRTLAMALRTLAKHVVVAATTGEYPSGLVNRSRVAARTARVPHVPTRETDLRDVASATKCAIGEVAQIEAMWLVATRALNVAGVKRAL
jgi:hypothetical protein